MKSWMTRFSFSWIVAFVALACSLPALKPEQTSRTSKALTGAVAGVSIAAGWGHTCELLSDGTVQCWGHNSFGELGLGVEGGTHNAPAAVPGLTGVTAISGSYAATCALLTNQTVECWGSGYGPSPVAIAGVSGAVTISASGEPWSFACAVLSTGNLTCWGDNAFGELGNGNGSSAPGTMNPAGLVSNLSAVVSVATHAHGACAMLSNGTVQCWGANVSGELGIGTATPPSTCYAPYNWPCSTVPAAAVSGLTDVVAITAGDGDYVCAQQLSGTVSCWGDNSFGQLGDGTTTARPAPVPVNGLNATPTAISAGMDHSCAALPGGAVQCWGSNGSGQLGGGATTLWWGAVSVVGVSTATAVNAGGSHSCALLLDGSVTCWGQNTYGQLGDGTLVSSPVPQGPTPGVNPIEVAAGWGHTCSLLPSGSVQCWGDNSYGELGLGLSGGSYPIPITVPGLSGVIFPAAGGHRRSHESAIGEMSDGEEAKAVHDGVQGRSGAAGA